MTKTSINTLLLGAALAVLPSAAVAEETAQTVATPTTVEPSAAPAESKKVDELLDLSLEELLSQQVTSVAKKSRRVADSAAAVTVISQEDIRRSSARTVPDLLRMVPGLEIAEVQSSATSVSARGFTSRFAANLLVMIDGAAIYSTSISGMFWDQALIPLQDIERIEVIRGPGGALWGSNAINGVVNIITKQSVDTQGLRMDVSVGTFDQRYEVGYGKQLNEKLGFRLYGAFRHTKGLDGRHGPLPDNSWNGGLVGIRFDYAPTEKDSVVVLGEYSQGKFDERYTEVALTPAGAVEVPLIQANKFHTKHLLARWAHNVSDDFDLSGQIYFNNLYRTEFGTSIDRNLYDASIEGRVRLNTTNELNFGLSGRLSRDKVRGTFSLSLPSEHNVDRWLTGYLQDEINVIPDKLRLTIGSKFELNNFTGFEIQPSVRMLYRFNPNFAAWGAVSRAVRTPLLLQREMIANVTRARLTPLVPYPLAVNSTFLGNKDAKAEEVISYEAGFRGSFGGGWSYDVAAFHSRYDRLTTGNQLSQAPVFLPPSPYPVGVQTNLLIGNGGKGKSSGVEALINGPITNWWKVELSYSYLDLKVRSGEGSYILAGSGGSPNHQLRAKSSMQINDKLHLDIDVHHVGKAQADPRKAYTDLDVRASYQVNPNLELSLVGSNLLKERRLEYYQDALPIEEVFVPRTAFVEARMRF